MKTETLLRSIGWLLLLSFTFLTLLVLVSAVINANLFEPEPFRKKPVSLEDIIKIVE